MFTHSLEDLPLTAKKENILNTALKLFASQGFDGVSTSRIAKDAGVSEGLIFKHFKNKKGLLDAISLDGELRMNETFIPMFAESNAQLALKKFILMPFEMDPSTYDYWILQFKMGWEKEYYDASKLNSLEIKLIEIFSALGYEEPENEAILLIHIIESIVVRILKEGVESRAGLKAFLLKKYKL